MAYWLDYSAGKLSGSTIRNAGYTGVIRYIDAPNLLGTKHTNLDEYRSHLAAGLTVRLVHQGTTRDADSGWQGGVNRATRAKAGADYLGYDGVIVFANDRTTVPNVAAWQAYLDGAASVLGRERVGAYGFYNALNAAVDHASAFWQAGRRSDLVPHANYWQDNNVQVTVGGITCDRNLVVSDYSPISNPVAGKGFSDMSDAYPTPKVLADGSYRYHVSLSNWDKVNGRYVSVSTGFSGCEFEVWVQLQNGSYVSSPSQIPSGSYGKVLKGSLAPDNVHWLGIPSGAQSVSVQVRPSTADGVPGVTVFTDGK